MGARANKNWDCRGAARLLAVALLCCSASIANAQLNLTSYRAQDGTVYEVLYVANLPNLLGGAEEVRVTTLGGSVNGFQTCSQSGVANAPVKAGSGVDMAAGQVLHPLSETVRTTVLNVVDPTDVQFGAIGSGLLVFGGGANNLEVCRESNYCSGANPVAPLVAMSTTDSRVPAACVGTLTAACGSLTTVGFGLASSGGLCTAMPTVATTICAPRPTDGFTLGKGEAIVIVYNHSLGLQGFSIGAAGFGIDTDDQRLVPCVGSNIVVTADAHSPSAPSRAPLPSQKPAPALSTSAFVITALLLVLAGVFLATRPARASTRAH